MEEQTKDNQSERIRYADSLGQNWYGTLFQENRDGRRFRFELESGDENLPLNTGELIASEIGTSDWLALRGEKGRYLQLARPLITSVPYWPAIDRYGSCPFVVRGIAHDLIESRFAVEPSQAQVGELWFTSNPALFVLGEQLQGRAEANRVSIHKDIKYEYEIRGLGRVTFHLDALQAGERHATKIKDNCRIAVMPEAPLTLKEAQEAFYRLTVFLDCLFGQPTELPIATLVTASGSIGILLGGKPYAAKMDTSGVAAAIPVSAGERRAEGQFGHAALGEAMQTFWDQRQQLIQPINVALSVLHLNNDMLWRLFVTLPTLEKLLPVPAPSASQTNVESLWQAFLQHVEKDEVALSFCREYIATPLKAKPMTFAKKLEVVVDRMGVAGWNLPPETVRRIKNLRDKLAHTATTKETPFDQLWPLLAAAVAILIFLICEILGIPLNLVKIGMVSNFRAIGQVVNC